MRRTIPNPYPTLCRALLACLLLSACGASGKYTWVHQRKPEPIADRVLIGAGDLLEIKVYGDEESSTTTRVLADGTVTMPLLGAVQVVGHRPEGLAKSLELQLKRHITEPKVTVVIRESVVSVSVIGEVRQVRTVQLVAPATVIEALAEAGGLTEFADDTCIFVLRKRGDHTDRIRFSYEALTQADPAASTFQLKTGDTVVVE